MDAKITFSVAPWLLILVVPVFAAIIAPLFIGRKRGSAITANRILSAVLQCVAAACCIFALAGIRVEYGEANVPAELVILVDGSYTADGQRGAMDGLVREVLEENGGRCRVAVVLFGYGQKVAVEMGDCNPDEAYAKYLAASAESNVECATDIASALRLAWDSSPGAGCLISNPSRAKVLILSDGLETDGDAIGAMKMLTRDGVQIETSFFADGYLSDISVLGVSYPGQSLFANREIELKVAVKSALTADAVLHYSDTDESGSEKSGVVDIELKAGTQEINIKHSFESPGFHKMFFRLEAEGDKAEENNIFCSFCNVEESEKLLILEAYGGESSSLQSAVSEAYGEQLWVDTFLFQEAGGFTAEELSAYSEVILYNGAQEDMTAELQNALYKYVNDFGGGLFTVGGFEKDGSGNIITEPKYRDSGVEVPVRHSYSEEDLKGSVLETMLPVTVEEYKPAVAVVFVFDLSSSMTVTNGPIHAAVADVSYVLDNIMEPRDYAGIVTLQDSYAETDPLRPITQKDILKSSIAEFESFYDFNAPTRYAPALQQAADMLYLAPSNVARRHIVLLSDGGPGDKFDAYGKVMEEAGKRGITITVVTYYKRTREIEGETYYFNHDYDVKGYEINVGNMQRLAEFGNGTLRLIQRSTFRGWEDAFRKDMRLDELGDIGYDSYSPAIGELSSEVLGNITNLDLKELTLGGYFPCRRKVDESVNVPLLAEGSPLYAQWQFGEGRVGSILIDLEGVMSQDLIEKETGRTLVKNIISSLLRQVKSVEKSSIDATLSEGNFSTQVNVYGYGREDDNTKLVAFVLSPNAAEEPQKFDLGVLSGGGSRFIFKNTQTGVYTVQLLKIKDGFNISSAQVRSAADIPAEYVLEKEELYKPFSYSAEYNGDADPYTTGQELLAALSTREAKDGVLYSKFVYDAKNVFEANGVVSRIYEPRLWLLIAALTLYFAGIVARRVKLFPRHHRQKT